VYPLLQNHTWSVGLNPTDGTQQLAITSTLAAEVSVQRISTSFVLQLSTNQT
jgi:hypothetical protein